MTDMHSVTSGEDARKPMHAFTVVAYAGTILAMIAPVLQARQ